MLKASHDPMAMAMGKGKKIKIGILFGGKSVEHEVSLTSAASVISALDPKDFAIAVIGITKFGKLAGKAEIARMLPPQVLRRVHLYSKSDILRLRSDSRAGFDRAGRSVPEIIFPLLHGPNGEDGTIQGLLELAGVPYIGCGVLASAAGMDKDVMKRLFLQAGLPSVPYCLVQAQDLNGNLSFLRKSTERRLGYPMFSKPANLGSSVGICKIHSAREFEKAIRFSAQYDSKIIIEKGIDARELECGILGNGDPKASVVGEVHPSRDFYDYTDKYESSDSSVEIPAQITPKIAEEVRDIAVRAFKAIDGSGLARVDFFLERGSGKVWLNEINTMPGFTPISMYPKLWEASGVPFGKLVQTLVFLGFERFRERSKMKTTWA
jgi:D-alanine-D-alanine ligase